MDGWVDGFQDGLMQASRQGELHAVTTIYPWPSGTLGMASGGILYAFKIPGRSFNHGPTEEPHG